MATVDGRGPAQAGRGNWGSRLGFILAASGSAVGLGNVWRFPYVTGENGGGLFVLIYLFCIVLVGVPIMAAEIMVGRAAGKQPVGAFEQLQGKGSTWTTVGWMGVLAGFVILSFYVVVAGWAMDYTLKSIVNFSEPIHKIAERQATVYRASTSVVQMRGTLARQRAERESRQAIADIRRRAPGSVWDGYARYKEAIKAAGESKEAKAALLEDGRLQKQVALAAALEGQIRRVRLRAAADAAKFYEKIGDAAVRSEAETAKRRELIAEKVGGAFDKLVKDGWTTSFWTALFVLLVVLVVAGGVSDGIERTCRVLMPMLVIVMSVMVVYGMFQRGFNEAIAFVFKPDPTRLKPSGILEALGQAFFTLSLGMGAMMTYGSYQKSKEHLVKQSMMIAAFDTGIALLACVMIFPITFSYGQQPAAGPGLVFKSMPLAFAEIGHGGMLLAILFFGLLLVAALTSAISLLEVVASYFIDQRGWSRRRAAWTMGGVVLLFGLPSAFALDPSFIMSSWNPTFGRSFLDTMDYLASNWLLPLGGLLIAVYAGWVMPKRARDAELEGLNPLWIKGWLMLVRFVAPLLVVLVLLQKVGVLDADELMFALFR